MRAEERVALRKSTIFSATACQGKVIFVEKPCEELERTITQLGAQTSLARHNSDVFVAENPAEPGARTKWAAALKGCWVVATQTLMHPQLRGAAVLWQCALQTRRKVYWTDRARESNPRVHTLWVAIMAKPQRKMWQLLANEEAFVVEKNAAVRQKRSPTVIAIAAEDAEMDMLNNKLASPGPTASKRHIFLLPEAFAFLSTSVVVHTGACVHMAAQAQ